MPVQCTGCGKAQSWGSAMTTSSGDEKKNVRGESAFTKMLNAGSRYTGSGSGEDKSKEGQGGSGTRTLSYEHTEYAPGTNRFSTENGGVFPDVKFYGADGKPAESGLAGNVPVYTYADDDTSTSDGEEKTSKRTASSTADVTERSREPRRERDAETSRLAPNEEARFAVWVKQNHVRDLDHPDAAYDYRGAFKAGLHPGTNGHWPDTYKQHGHETFSEESKYSTGTGDGGTWTGDKFTPGTSTSDGNAKRDVSEGTKRESGMSGALGALNAVTYDYKDPERDGWGKHAGIIAQDAQEHPIAALMVEQDPHDGRLVLDNKKALSFSLAAAADLDKRMRAVEGKRRT